MTRSQRPPLKAAGALFLVACTAVVALVYFQFRGELTSSTRLTILANRSGLVLERGASVTYNGVRIGHVVKVDPVAINGATRARLLADIGPKYVARIPANVRASIDATSVFGGKVVALSSPQRPSPRRITSTDVIDVSAVTTEYNTIFENLLAVAEKVDPVNLNATLTAVAQAVDGAGDKFGHAVTDGNDVLAELNSQMPAIRANVNALASVADIYTAASPDLFSALGDLAVTAHTLTDQWRDINAALLAAIGIADTGATIFARAAPFYQRLQADSVPSTELADEYSPEIFCTIRNYNEVLPLAQGFVGGNGYSIRMLSEVMGAGNPYVYPDNLPRTNAAGGPEGRPGCWQKITRELWPAPYLVMDTGASIAPYNHVGIGQPLLTDYVWGRQIGEHTINP